MRRRVPMVVAGGLCLIAAGIAGLIAGTWLAMAAALIGALLLGGVVPWLLVSPYLRDESARSRQRAAGSRRNGGSLGFVPDLIERDTRAREQDR